MESSRRPGRGRGRRSRGDRFRQAEDTGALRKPQFKKVEDIEPEMQGVNLKLKVAGPNNRGEVLMGDDSGTVVVIVNDSSLHARISEGTDVYVRNGFVEMKDDAFIRLAVNEWGKIQLADERFDFVVKRNNNISDIEYTVE
jgi:replication factor A1